MVLTTVWSEYDGQYADHYMARMTVSILCGQNVTDSLQTTTWLEYESVYCRLCSSNMSYPWPEYNCQHTNNGVVRI